MNATPRLRGDLKATPIEDEGIKYFDVHDPRSGAEMRLYDFEWLIAQRMDGARRFDEVAGWAEQSLGIRPTPNDLQVYADRLAELGFFEAGAARPSMPQPVQIEEDIEETPLPKPHPGDEPRPSMAASGHDDVIAHRPPPIEVEVAPPQPATMQMEAPARIDDLPPPPKPPVTHTSGPAAPMGIPPVAEPLPPPPQPAKKSSAGSIVALLVVLALVGGGVAYMQFFRAPSAKVSVTLASPREVMRLYDGSGTVKKGEAEALSFGEAGKVVDVVAKGAEVKAGQALATLDGFAAFEKQLVDVKDRLGFYEKQLAAAEAKKAEPAIAAAKSKVDEKKKLLTDLEAKAAKVRLVAPADGTVSDVMVKAGDDVKPGSPAVKMGDSRVTAEFKLAGAGPAVGDTVSVQPGAGAPVSGKVVTAKDGDTVVELPADTTLKAGDTVRLVKAKQPNVVTLPAAAVVKRDGGDAVFVLSDGKARLRKVTVVDRTPTEVLVGSGLATGDSVITSNADSLQDGQAASTN